MFNNNKDKYNINKKKDVIKFVNENLDAVVLMENVDIDVNSVSLFGYYNSDFFKKKFKLYNFNDKIRLIKTPFLFNAFEINNRIFIFLNYYKKDKKERNATYAVAALLNTCFHEYEHSRHRNSGYVFQTIREDNNFAYSLDDCVINIIENVIIDIDYNFYMKYHDYFLSEIDANLYGAIKANKVMHRNEDVFKNKTDYKKALKYLDKEFEIWYYFRDNFDFDFIFDKYHMLKGEYKDNKNIIDDLIYENGSNNFRSISDIFSDKNCRKFDINFINHIITSRAYLSQFSLEDFSYDEVKILINALRKFDKVYKKNEYNQAEIIFDEDGSYIDNGMDMDTFYNYYRKSKLLEVLENNLSNGLYDKDCKIKKLSK